MKLDEAKQILKNVGYRILKEYAEPQTDIEEVKDCLADNGYELEEINDIVDKFFDTIQDFIDDGLTCDEIVDEISGIYEDRFNDSYGNSDWADDDDMCESWVSSNGLIDFMDSVTDWIANWIKNKAEAMDFVDKYGSIVAKYFDKLNAEDDADDVKYEANVSDCAIDILTQEGIVFECCDKKGKKKKKKLIENKYDDNMKDIENRLINAGAARKTTTIDDEPIENVNDEEWTKNFKERVEVLKKTLTNAFISGIIEDTKFRADSKMIRKFAFDNVEEVMDTKNPVKNLQTKIRSFFVKK